MRRLTHWQKYQRSNFQYEAAIDGGENTETYNYVREREVLREGLVVAVVEWWGSPDCPPKLQYGSVLFTEITLTERSEQSTTEWQTGTEVEPHQQARQPQSILIKQTSRDLYLFSFRECWQWNQRKVNYKIKSQKGRIGGGIKFKV